MKSTTAAQRITKVAKRRIDAFEERFGKPHLYLAYHAAFPLALTPDLLYSLWAKFNRDINDNPLHIPWVAVADLLISSLCQEVGQELYEMDEAVRKELLQRLSEDENFGQQQIKKLADFLLEYVQQQLNSNDPDIQDFAQAQKWTALAYTQRADEVAHELASKLREIVNPAEPNQTNETIQMDKTEMVRMASLIETLADPLIEANLEPLLFYARGMENFARGKEKQATDQLEKYADNGKIKIAGEELPIPKSIQEKLASPSKKKFRGQSFKGKDLTGENFRKADIRSADFTNAILIDADFTGAKTGLQRRWATLLMLCSLLLLVLSAGGSALLGTLLGSLLSPLNSESNTPNHTLNIINILVFTGVVSSLVFAVVYLANIRQRRLAIGRALNAVFLSCLVLICIAAFIEAFLGRKLQFPLSSSTSDTINVLTGLAIALLFPVPLIITLFKGLRAFWVADALALSGGSYFAAGVAFCLAMVWSSTQGQGAVMSLSLAGVAFVLALGFVLNWAITSARKVNRATRNKVLIVGGSSAIALTGALILSNVFGAAKVTFFIALAEFALVLAVMLIRSGMQVTTLAQTFRAVILFAAFVALIAVVVVVFGILNSPTSQVVNQIPSVISLVAMVIINSLVLAVFLAIPLVIAGTCAVSGSIVGVITVAVAIAISFALIWASDKVMSSDWAQAIAFAEMSIVIVALAWAMVVTIAVGIALAWTESENITIALVWSLAVTVTTIAIAAVTFTIAENSAYVVAGTIIFGSSGVGLGTYIGWRAVMNDQKFAFIRNFAIAFAARGGTSFRGADLTNAVFTQATLKSADFRQANLTHATWFKAKKLDRACVEKSYLQYPQVQQLALTSIGQEQNFDYLNLQGINLPKANLADASFIGTNLSQANLRGANLTKAKLVQTQLDQADLRGACLTGACIQDRRITAATKLQGVECEYIYTRVLTKENPDPGRKPDDPRKMFKPGEFARFLKRSAQTIQSDDSATT